MRDYYFGLYRVKAGEKEYENEYTHEKFTRPIYKEKKMKIRVMSDLHLDYNQKYPLELKDKDTFTIIAGDLSGYSEYRDKWLKENTHKGIFVEGNHIFYNNENKTLQQLYKDLEEKYPLDSNVSFLQNQHKVINNVVFVGCTLWTDCRLNGYKSTRTLQSRMNDYRYGRYLCNEGLEDEFESVFEPELSIKEFNKSLNYIESICDEYSQNKIVVVTHHCPSQKCISPYYRSSDCNQAYASNLESFIQNHSNIVCWICGHSHNSCDFKIDGCRVIMNCRGYVPYGEDKDFNPNKIIYI